jgi:serine phosphatase RsbU (regulator of sigma subunit)
MLEVEIGWEGKSHAFKLDDGEHTVGRSGENDIKVPAARVSKSHAVIRVQGERLFVRDLGSTNGTEINGRRGGSDETEVPAGALVSFAGALLRRATELPISQSFVGRGQVTTRLRHNVRDGYSAAARDRIVDMSGGLFELLASGGDDASVGEAACRFVSQSVVADRVVLLEDRGEATAVEVRARWIRAGDTDAPLQLSSTIVSEVVSQRDAILVANPVEDPRYVDQHSILSLNLRSAMAAPLFDNRRVRGILYVDTANPEVRYDKADLEVLTATANAVAVKLRNLSFERELRTAAQIQRAMLPPVGEPPEGYEVEAFQLMCRAVGGDLYHCASRGEGRYLVALGDVSGKGMPAALAMGAATVLIGMLAEIDDDLSQLVRHLHRQLFRSLTEEQFLTLFVGEFDAKAGVLRYVNAGHEPPLVMHADGSCDALDSTGLPVAMIEEPMFETAEVALAPGDVIAVFSDGIPEATTDGERFLGLERVKEQLCALRGEGLSQIRERIIGVVQQFLGGESTSDDLTLILMRRRA